MKYYNLHTKSVYTEDDVVIEFKTNDLQELNKNGIYLLVNGSIPHYDKYTQILKTNEPVLSSSERVYIVTYTVSDMTETETLAVFENLKEQTKVAINKLVSTNIFSGFDVEMHTSETVKEMLHFSYDQFDQGNFTDGLNASLIAMKYGDAVKDVMPTSVDWNAYRNYNVLSGGELIVLHLEPTEYIQLYLSAMTHKQKNMILGQQLKNELSAITTLVDLQSFITKYNLYIE